LNTSLYCAKIGAKQKRIWYNYHYKINILNVSSYQKGCTHKRKKYSSSFNIHRQYHVVGMTFLNKHIQTKIKNYTFKTQNNAQNRVILTTSFISLTFTTVEKSCRLGAG